MSIAPALFGLIARSPFRRIEDHMNMVAKCGFYLLPTYEDIAAQNWDGAAKKYNKVRELESKADAIKRKVRIKLHRNLFLPVARTDLLSLLVTQDNLANQTKDVIGLMIGRKMVFPEEIQGLMMEYLQTIHTTIDQAKQTIGELSDLQESGFGRNVIHLAESMITEIDRLESKTDDIQIQIRQKLFVIEKDHAPVDVIFWYSAIEKLGEVADWAQRIGAKLLQILSH